MKHINQYQLYVLILNSLSYRGHSNGVVEWQNVYSSKVEIKTSKLMLSTVFLSQRITCINSYPLNIIKINRQLVLHSLFVPTGMPNLLKKIPPLPQLDKYVFRLCFQENKSSIFDCRIWMIFLNKSNICL